MDQWPPDTITYYTFREFSQTVVDHLDDGNFITYITYITFDPSTPEHTFNLIVNALRVREFTADMWHQRAEPKHRLYKLDTVLKATEIFSIVLLVSNPMLVRRSLSSAIHCEKSFLIPQLHVKCVIVHEIFIDSHGVAEKRGLDLSCVHTIQSDFRSLVDFTSNFDKMDIKVRSYMFVWYFHFIDDFLLYSVFSEFYLHFYTVFKTAINTFIFLKPLFDIELWTEKPTAAVLNTIPPCSYFHRSPLTVQNKHEVEEFRDTFLNIKYSLGLPAAKTYKLSFGLKQIKAGGHRFHWGQGKDLLFSHWAPGEPRNNHLKRCASWSFFWNNQTLIDEKWNSVECDRDDIYALVCERKRLPPNKSLEYTKDAHSSGSSISTKGSFGELLIQGSQEWRVLTSMSSIVTSGYLHSQWEDIQGTSVRGLVSGGNTTFYSRSELRDLLELLRPMIHVCENDQSQDLGKQFNKPQSVPLSLVCDGKKDCPSGSDESTCWEPGSSVCDSTLFQCRSGQCVPPEARCDLLPDCQDETDEENCESECPHRMCRSGRCLPRSWFHDGVMDCDDGDDESGTLPVDDKPCVFICNRFKCVTENMLNDSVVDCQGPEGPLDETLGALEPFTCFRKNGKFTNWAPKCVVARDLFGQIIGCRDFQHLSQCKEFQCPIGYVKCPNSFCIPLSNVKDGKEDCDYGEDEGVNPLPNLVNYFKCSPTRAQAVRLSNVCDGRRDCQQGEDELDCGHHCPPGILCLAGAISAAMYNKTLPLEDLSFIHADTRYLDLSGVSGIPEFFNIYPRNHLSHLMTLKLSGCGIKSVKRRFNASERYFFMNENECKRIAVNKDFQLVKRVDMSFNEVTELSSCSFISLMFTLEVLNLSYNAKLSNLSPKAFRGLKLLTTLDLSYTGLSSLAPDVFDGLASLKELSLEGTSLVSIKFVLPETTEILNVQFTNIADVGEDVFSKVTNIRKVNSSTYKLCCPAVLGSRIPKHLCHYTGSAVSSCANLIKEPQLRFVAWSVGLVTLVGNAAALVYRLIWDREMLKKPYGFFVTNLGVSDLIMGVYLIIIAVKDAAFHGKYVIYDYIWRRSSMCQATGVLVTLASITSTLFISLIMVDRYLAVRFPYGKFRFSLFRVYLVVTGAWCVGLLTALLPISPFTQHWKVFSTNGMCVALPLGTERHPGQWYGTTLFVGFNLLSFIFIGVGQTLIYLTLKKTGKRTRKSMSKHSQLYQNQKLQEFEVAKRLFLIVITDFMCWFPIITMGVMALAGVNLGDAAYRWSALLVLPINSALNPVLYTLPDVRKRWENFKEARRQKRKAAANRRRLTGKTAVSKRCLLRKCCRSLVKIRLKILTRPKRNLVSYQYLDRLHSRVKGLTSYISEIVK